MQDRTDDQITLEEWDNRCFMCGKKFDTGDSYRFISFDNTTHIINDECEKTLRSIIKEFRSEHLTAGAAAKKP